VFSSSFAFAIKLSFIFPEAVSASFFSSEALLLRSSDSISKASAFVLSSVGVFVETGF